MNEGKTHFADDATLDHIANLERENADLRAQIAAMRPVVEASLGLLHGDSIHELSATWALACEEYESKLPK